MANDEEQIDVQAENEQRAVGLAQRAARILHNLPFMNIPLMKVNSIWDISTEISMCSYTMQMLC